MVKFAFDGEVIELGGGPVDFQLDESHNAGEEVVALGVGQFGGRFGEGGVAFERLMVFLHFPPFWVDRVNVGARESQVTGAKFQDALSPIFVFEDLTGYYHGEGGKGTPSR